MSSPSLTLTSLRVLFLLLDFYNILTPAHISLKNCFAVLPTFHYPIKPSHLRHLWPLWPSLCSPINPPPRPITAHAHLAGPAGRAAGPGLPGLPSIHSSWKSHLPILLLSNTIKTQTIYNKSVSDSIWERKKKGAQCKKKITAWSAENNISSSYQLKVNNSWTFGLNVGRCGDFFLSSVRRLT